MVDHSAHGLMASKTHNLDNKKKSISQNNLSYDFQDSLKLMNDAIEPNFDQEFKSIDSNGSQVKNNSWISELNQISF